MTFTQGLAFTFRESRAFLREAWWLALLVAITDLASPLTHFLPEDLQWAGFVLAEALPEFGAIALYYVFVRYIALRHDLHAALEMNVASARTFAPFAAYYLVTSPYWLTFADQREWQLAIVLISVAATLAMPLLTLWIATAPSGGTVIGPARSAKLAFPHYLWGLALLLSVNAAVLAIFFAVVWFARAQAFQAFLALGTPPGQIAVALFLGAISIAILVPTIALCFAIAMRAGLRVDDSAALASTFA